MKKVIAILVLSVLGFLAWHLTNKDAPTNQPKNEPPQQAEGKSPAKHYRALINFYLTQHDQYKDKFWLTGEIDQNNPGPHMGKIADWSKNLAQQIERFASLNDLTERIAQNFLDFRTTMAVRVGNSEASMDIFLGKNNMLDQAGLAQLSQRLEVAVVPESLWHRDRYPSPVFYFISWRAIKVVGVEMPSLYQVALIYHEMGHALRDRVDNAPSVHASNGSDLWISEEIEMHELESDILDEGTNGALFSLYAKIRGRTKDGDVNNVIKAVTNEDLMEYDRIFKIEQAGPAMASIYLAQFFIGLGFYTLDENHRDRTPEERMLSKIAYYRFVRTM